MGYMSRMDLVEVAIKPECVRIVKKAIRASATSGEVPWILERLNIDPDGFLQWNWRKDRYGPIAKFHDGDEELVNWLKDYCTGGLIAFWGQEGDGSAWAYEFDGKGHVRECSPRRAAAIKGWAARKNPERDDARYERMIAAQRAGRR